MLERGAPRALTTPFLFYGLWGVSVAPLKLTAQTKVNDSKSSQYLPLHFTYFNKKLFGRNIRHTGVFIGGAPKDELLASEYKWTYWQNRTDQSE